MKKATFYTLIGHNGEKIAQEKTGYTFTDYGYTFNLYKIGSVWCVLEASTGLQVFQARTIKEAPAMVPGYIDALKAAFERSKAFIEEAQRIIAEAVGKTDAQPTEKRKPAKNTIKRSTVYITARKKYDSNGGAVGDVFEIKKDSFSGWIGANTRTGEKFALFVSQLRSTDAWEIVRQESAQEHRERLDAEKIQKDAEMIAPEMIAEILENFETNYNNFYEAEPAPDVYAGLVARGDDIIGTQRTLVTALTKARGDYFASDREAAALAAAFVQYEEHHQEPIPTETETPATSAGTVRTEKTKPCTPCTMTAARRKWYNICGNVYRSGTEPNHGASPLKSILRHFESRTLASLHRTEKRGYMKATRSHKAIWKRTGTPPGRTRNRTQPRTNCEVMARGSPENIASLQALILAS